MKHIADLDLERYHLGMVVEESELAALEKHLLACPECADRAEENAVYVDRMRAAIIAGGFDFEQPSIQPAASFGRRSDSSSRSHRKPGVEQ